MTFPFIDHSSDGVVPPNLFSGLLWSVVQFYGAIFYFLLVNTLGEEVFPGELMGEDCAGVGFVEEAELGGEGGVGWVGHGGEGNEECWMIYTA